MAGITASGVGSGLDINGLVTQLMAAERAPTTARFTREQQKVATEISALGQLKGALGAFQTSLDGLRTPEKFATRSATSSDTDILTATSDVKASPGSYDITVENLAKAQQIASDPFAGGGDSVVGTGTLTVSLGSTSVNITIGSEKNTLAHIRDAINLASGDKGVRATLVSSTEGSRLVLSSTKTGEANVIKVTQSGGDGGLSKLVYDKAANQTSNFDELRPAQDALIKIGTFEKKSANNVITDAIDGVTLTLKDVTEEDKPIKLDVSYDRTAVSDRVKKFVDAYNSLKKTVTNLGGYDAALDKAGPLLGDALLRSVDADVRRGLTDPIDTATGNFQTLASIGVVTNKDGTLSVESSKLQTALDTDFSGVAAIFSSSDGVAARIYTDVTAKLSSSSDIAARNRNLDTKTKSIISQQAAAEVRLDSIEARYRRQFSALDSLLQKMQSQSNFLSQQFAALAK
jgi:flagellar hook-associated protein 2